LHYSTAIAAERPLPATGDAVAKRFSVAVVVDQIAVVAALCAVSKKAF